MDFKYPTSALLGGYATKTRKKRKKQSMLLYGGLLCAGSALVAGLLVAI